MYELQVCLFALKLLLMYDVPIEFGKQAFIEATRYGVDPDDVAAMLVTEHRGAYPTDSVSNRGCIGLYQLWPGWVWNDKIGTKYRKKDLYDWKINTEIAVRAIRYMQDRHAFKCKKKKHTWVAHYKCTNSAYEHCRPEKRAHKVRRRLGFVPIHKLLQPFVMIEQVFTRRLEGEV